MTHCRSANHQESLAALTHLSFPEFKLYQCIPAHICYISTRVEGWVANDWENAVSFTNMNRYKCRREQNAKLTEQQNKCCIASNKRKLYKCCLSGEEGWNWPQHVNQPKVKHVNNNNHVHIIFPQKILNRYPSRSSWCHTFKLL